MRLARSITTILLCASAAGAWAQPVDLRLAPVTTNEYPAGVSVAPSPQGPVFVDQHGATLYGLDMRTVLRDAPNPAKACDAACLNEWEPLRAPQNMAVNIEFPKGFNPSRDQGVKSDKKPLYQAQNAPDWTIIDGVQGPQWVYKGWHLVFIRRDATPGSIAFDGANQMTWNTLKYIPPVPTFHAPNGVKVKFSGGAYVLTDIDGYPLFTGHCATLCADWTPFPAAMASRGVGRWHVSLDHDTPQWLYGDTLVYVSKADNINAVPTGGQIMRVDNDSEVKQ